MQLFLSAYRHLLFLILCRQVFYLVDDFLILALGLEVNRETDDGYCRDRQRQTRGNKGGLDLVDTWSTKIHAVINSVDVNGNERNVSNIVWAENPAYDGATGIASMTNDESQNGYRGQSVTSHF